MVVTRSVILALLSAFWFGAAVAEDTLPPEPGIEATITAQIDAFLNDDFETAFTYASPNIQGIFGNSDRFGMMVRQGYPMVWRPDNVEYLELRNFSGALWQRVKIRDRDGRLHFLDYQMIETGDGWKIDGVQILQAPGISA